MCDTLLHFTTFLMYKITYYNSDVNMLQIINGLFLSFGQALRYSK